MKILIFFYLFTSGLLANTLEIVSDNEVLHGDPVNVVMRIEGVFLEEDLNEAIKKSEKKLGPFYVYNIGFVKNEEGKTIIGLNTFYDDTKFLGNITIQLSKPLSLNFINPEKLNRVELKPEAQFRYYTRSFNIPGELNYLFYILAVIFFFIGFVLLKRYLDHKKALREEKEYHQNWVRAFKACYKREDYERIYKERNKWMPLVGNISKKFIKTLNKHQYKKEWSQDDMAQVTEDFNKVKEKLIENGV